MIDNAIFIETNIETIPDGCRDRKINETNVMCSMRIML